MLLHGKRVHADNLTTSHASYWQGQAKEALPWLQQPLLQQQQEAARR
jgi:hypothetical protein